MYRIDPPVYEEWLVDGFPPEIQIDGRTFVLAERKQPYQGCIEQYREAVPRDSMHLMVLDDGHWMIDHVDEYNPDMGFPVRHFIVDHPAGKGALIAGAGLLGIGAATLYGRKNQ